VLRVGKYNVFYSAHFIANSQEEVVVETDFVGEAINARYRFLENAADKNMRLTVEPDPADPGRALVSIINWSRASQVFAEEAVNFMTLDSGGRLYFYLSATYSNGFYKVFVQYMHEGTR
jgi:hypothetical protein